MDFVPAEVLTGCIIPSIGSVLGIIRLGMATRLFYEMTKSFRDQLYDQDGSISDYYSLLDDMHDLIDGAEIKGLLLKHLENRKEIDNAPLNCTLEYIKAFIRTGEVQESLPLPFWENSVGSALSYIYCKANLKSNPKLELVNIIDGGYDKLLETGKLKLPSIECISLYPARIPLNLFRKILKHYDQECLMDICTSNDYVSFSDTEIRVLGRYGSEDQVLNAATQLNLERQKLLLSTALMNVSLSVEAKINLINMLFKDDPSLGCLALQKTNPLVLIMAMTKQPLEIYEALYEIRKRMCPIPVIDLERSLMMDLSDKECINLITKEYYDHITLISLAVIKQRSASLFSAFEGAFPPFRLPDMSVTEQLHDPEIVFCFPVILYGWDNRYIGSSYLNRLLPYFTPPAAMAALRNLLLNDDDLTVGDLAGLNVGRDIICTIFKLLIESILKKQQWETMHISQKHFQSNLVVMTNVLRLFSDAERQNLSYILATETDMSSNTYTLLRRALEQVRRPNNCNIF